MLRIYSNMHINLLNYHALKFLFLGSGGLSYGSITLTWWLNIFGLFTSAVDFPEALVGLWIFGRTCFFKAFVDYYKFNLGIFYFSII
jgi:hypothetical protein